jgi:mannosyltransferase
VTDADHQDFLPTRGSRWADAWSLAPWILTAVAVPIIFLGIGSKSFWFDEAFSALAVWDGFRHLASVLRGIEVNMAGYYVLLTAWMKLGHSDVWIRALSGAFAVATVPTMWAMARAVFDQRVALYATVLLGLNAMFVAYGQEARGYSAAVFSGVLCSWLLIRAMTRPAWPRWILYGLSAAWLPYTYILAGTLLIAHVIAVLVSRDRPAWRYLVGATAIAVIGMLPLAIAVVTGGGTGAPSARPTTGEVALATLYRLFGATPTGSAPTPADLLLLLVAAGVFLAGFVACLRGPWPWRGRNDRWPGWFALAIAIIPIAVIGVLSLVRPLLVARYLIVALPGMALVMAVALDRMRRPSLRTVVFVALAGLLAVGTLDWLRADGAKADWRAATAALMAQGRPEDRVLFQEQWTWRAMDYYARQADARRTMPRRLWRGLDPTAPDYAGQLEAAAAELAGEGRVLWVVSSATGRGMVDPTTDSLFAAVRRYYVESGVERFSNLSVTRFVPRG